MASGKRLRSTLVLCTRETRYELSLRRVKSRGDTPPPAALQPKAYRQDTAIVSQAARRADAGAPPEPMASLPRFHNVVLLESLKDPQQRLWYARQAVEHGWSRAVLVHWIESDLYARQGKAVTNFSTTLPPAQSELATEVMKDPYTFDFLTLASDAAERDLERALLDHIRRFLLELGAGFAFVGQQIHLEVGGEDFYLDLLFYHLRLRCFVVIDLKARPFQPEYAVHASIGAWRAAGQAIEDGGAKLRSFPCISVVTPLR